MTLPIKLESVYKGGTSKIAVVDRGVISIGRSQDNAIAVDSVSVSRSHGEFVCTGSHWIYKDLGSTNGSFINDVRLQPGHFKLVRNRDMVSLSNFHIAVSYLDGAPSDISNSIIVFHKDKFLSEYIPNSEEDVFYAGGENADITVAGENKDLMQFSIQFKNGTFSIQLFRISTPVRVSGKAINGFTQLYDSDEILVGDYVILINSQHSVRVASPLNKNIRDQAPGLDEKAYYSFKEDRVTEEETDDAVPDSGKLTTRIFREDASVGINAAKGISSEKNKGADDSVIPYLDVAKAKRAGFKNEKSPIPKKETRKETDNRKEVLPKKQRSSFMEFLVLLAGGVVLVLMLCLLVFLLYQGKFEIPSKESLQLWMKIQEKH